MTSITPRRSTGRAPEPPRRRPFRDNPRLILAGIAALIIALAVILVLANGTQGFSPDFLTEFVLYALSAADLTILVALVFVLARNIVKLVVERRRALPFARFRAKLVALLLAMTLVPAVLEVHWLANRHFELYIGRKPWRAGERRVGNWLIMSNLREDEHVDSRVTLLSMIEAVEGAARARGLAVDFERIAGSLGPMVRIRR